MTDFRESYSVGETEPSAYNLQMVLRDFAGRYPKDQEGRLRSLVSLIKEQATAETLAVLIYLSFQRRLIDAVNKTFETPFDVDGQEINPWSESKGHTIVALDNRGVVRGAVSSPTPGLEEYGDLHPYALTKAVMSLHLFKRPHPVKGSDIAKPKNYKHLREVTRTEIFNGSSRIPARLPGEFVPGKFVFIGGSGCAANEDYLRLLLGGAEPTHNSQAGRLDAIFCDLVQFYLQNDNERPETREEPEELQNLRFNN